ncbi:3'-5' exonuclease [Rhodoferax sp. AJA081-3]|uniref:3'-5' exonuclease n=1 Tax=Rhodoferax sp. AJA081-3 TaxID=2752316 RepID=UPI001AE00EBB|nr:3'-5' exonuclease [Rhodoferax sp. AJA081-3]
MTPNQLDFAFVAELPTLAPVAKKRAPRGKAAPAPAPAMMERTAAPPAPAVAQPLAAIPPGGCDDLEPLAMTLEAHPDYRVLRRLKPRLQWPSATGDGICRVVVLDTETTGLDHSRDKIIELALLRVDIDLATGLPVGEVQVYDELEDPGMPIPKEVQDITGINNAMVAGQRLDEAGIATLLEGVDLVIAHNAGFDRPFCEARLAAFSHLAWACSLADIPWREQGKRSSKLENLAQDLGCFYDAHRAEMDCHALLAVLAAKLPLLPHTGLAHVVDQAHKPSYRLMATNAPFDAKDKLKARGYRWSAEQKVWSTRIGDSKALEAEFAWLKENAYHQRAVVVQFEKLDAHVRYSSRPGEMLYHQL